MSLTDVSELTGLAKQTVWNRLFHLGWSVDRILATPARGRRRPN